MMIEVLGHLMPVWAVTLAVTGTLLAGGILADFWLSYLEHHHPARSAIVHHWIDWTLFWVGWSVAVGVVACGGG